MKNVFEGLINRLDIPKEIISDIEKNNANRNSQNRKEKTKMKRREQNIQESWENYKRHNYRRRKGKKPRIFEVIMRRIFQN